MNENDTDHFAPEKGPSFFKSIYKDDRVQRAAAGVVVAAVVAVAKYALFGSK
ncbi:MAG: hypothetical protein KF729_33760 [Sandaracinaceae bacterium]|nr:hypothetical protein [Sandaracinaceae bacterium]